MNSRILAALLALLVGLVPAAAPAFDLRPISRDFTPSGSGATQAYEVVNTGKDPVAINVSVITRAMDSAGVETHQSAEDDFLVYPPQFVVAPGARQSIRVSWLGNPQPRRELAYRLVVEQLPIERLKAKPSGDRPAGAAITVLKKYLGSLYIRPAKARPELTVESARLERGASGPPQLAVTLHNRGTARAVLKDYLLQVNGSGAQSSLDPETAAKTGVVLSEGRLLLRFPWPPGTEPGAVTVRERPRG